MTFYLLGGSETAEAWLGSGLTKAVQNGQLKILLSITGRALSCFQENNSKFKKMDMIILDEGSCIPFSKDRAECIILKFLVAKYTTTFKTYYLRL